MQAVSSVISRQGSHVSFAPSLNFSEQVSEAFSQADNYPYIGLLGFSAAWFNLFGTPGLPIQLSEVLKWQILFVSRASQDLTALQYEGFNLHSFPRCVAGDGFDLQALSPTDLAMLYRIIMAFLQQEISQGRINSTPSIFSRYYLALIGDFILESSVQNRTYLNELKVAVLQLEDPTNLEGLEVRLDKYSHLFSIVDREDRKEAVLTYLKDFYQNIEQMSEWHMEIEFYYFLKVLDKLCPELELFSYFFDFGNGIVNAVIADAPGLAILVEHFTNKIKANPQYQSKLDDLSIHPLADLTKQLALLEKEDFKGTKKYLILHGGPSTGMVGGHFSPVFIRREKGKVTLVIAESGPFEKNHWIPILLEQIQRANIKDLECFTFRPPRQSDNFSCPIMALRDILESCKFDLFAKIDSTDKSSMTFEQGFHVLAEHPTCLMKVKQGTKYIDGYEERNPESKTVVVATKIIMDQNLPRTVQKTLRQVVEAHTITRQGALVNFYLRKRAYKYYTLLVDTLVQQKLV